jgi:hypothetical protein
MVIIAGQNKAVAIAVKNNNAKKRWSMLEERLRNRFSMVNKGT